MNAKRAYEHRPLAKRNKGRVRRTIALLLLLPVGAWAGGVVTNCTEAAFRAAMAGGGTVTFACDGTITLTNTITIENGTTLDGSGHQASISGKGAVRVFSVNANISFTLVNLTITNGYDSNCGSAILLSLGGSVSLTGVALRNNRVSLVDLNFPPGASFTMGGAIGNLGGTVIANNCAFVGNSSIITGSSQAQTLGGAIYNGGTLSATNCIFMDNGATTIGSCGPYGPGQAFGGAIFNGGQANLRRCTFVDNGVAGKAAYCNGSADPGAGGAIYNGGAVTLELCSFTNNGATGGSGSASPWGCVGGAQGAGGAIYNRGTATLDLCSLTGNQANGGVGASASYDSPSRISAPSTPGGPGSGGAIYNEGTMTIDRSTLLGNTTAGGYGGSGISADPDVIERSNSAGANGAAAYGGAIWSPGSLRVTASTFAANAAVGGWGGGGGNAGSHHGYGGDGATGGNGGDGLGGALFSGMASLVNCTIASNSGSGGGGGSGGAGAGDPAVHLGVGSAGGNGGSALGGVYGTCNLTNCTVAWNQGSGGNGGTGGAGAAGSANGAPGINGAANGGTACDRLPNTLIVSNSPAGGDTFTDPKLGPLADNGGPTPTMALLLGSPAIDAGNTALAPTTDQRGFPRPAGAAADIGAFEYGSVMPALAASRSGATGLNLLATGNAGQPCRLLSSTDLTSWVPLATNQIGSDGTIPFNVNCAPGTACRFYRLAMP